MLSQPHIHLTRLVLKSIMAKFKTVLKMLKPCLPTNAKCLYFIPLGSVYFDYNGFQIYS